MRYDNSLVFEGFLGSDPEAKQTDSGTSYTKLWITWHNKYTDKKGVERESKADLNVTLWGKSAERFDGQKGDRVIFRGELNTTEYKGKKYTGGRPDRVDVVWRKNMPRTDPKPSQPAGDDDDLPF